jgi:hypothetical protein
MHMSVSKATALYGDAADVATDIEIMQMLDLKVWKEVDPETLSREEFRTVIYSLLFLKAKYAPDGEFEKLKARLVANGAQQDKSVYENVSSPTARLASVFFTAGMAARERRIVVTTDIVGAYLKVDMRGRKVRVRLPPYVAQRVLKFRPQAKKYLLRDGSLIVELLKAMYGCVESALLLFEKVTETLLGAGFVPNPYDECVFNKGTGDDQVTVVLYVDDIMVTSCNRAGIDELLAQIKEAFGTVQVHEGLVHNYLGMTFDFSKEGACTIKMDGYKADITEAFGVEGTAATPATEHLFKLREGAVKLGKKDREYFHSAVAKVLYLAKRIQPEALLAVSFLATRVKEPDEDDMVKLQRLLKYINGTHGMGLTLRVADGWQVWAHIDASYAVHIDLRSHTGGVITLGSGVLMAQSRKQKLVTKSSTEAELVAVSDFAGYVLEMRLFVWAQGYGSKPAMIGQDNLSTIALLTKGRASSEFTRHVNIRYFFARDRKKAGELDFVHVPAAEMMADALTKPLQGALFKHLRDKLLGVV